MAKSGAHELDRKRKPRVHITYDVEVGNAMKKKELPFVMGVMSDLSGNRKDPLPKMKERHFEAVDRENFTKFLANQKPRVAFQVEDKLTDDPDKQLGVDITFESMKDFEPEGVVDKVPVLKNLLEVRKQLKDLQTRAVSSDKVRGFIDEVLANADRLKEVAENLGGGEASGGGGDAPSESGDAPGEGGDAPREGGETPAGGE